MVHRFDAAPCVAGSEKREIRIYFRKEDYAADARWPIAIRKMMQEKCKRHFEAVCTFGGGDEVQFMGAKASSDAGVQASRGRVASGDVLNGGKRPMRNAMGSTRGTGSVQGARDGSSSTRGASMVQKARGGSSSQSKPSAAQSGEAKWCGKTFERKRGTPQEK